MAMTGIRRVLDDGLLDRIRGRARTYDDENRFPDDDLAELRDAGYLTALVPDSFGGGGLTLRELAHEQMRLAGAAPATALAVNMHHVWMGVARLMHARGEAVTDFVLKDAMAGEVFAFGISEPGNDLVLFGSTTRAEPDGDGGFRFHGTKIFTSLSPVWTRLGTFGTDSSDPDAPMSVFAFVDRDGGGFTVKDDWDTLGMRGSQSCTTVLDGAHAPADRVVRRIPPGPTRDPFVFGIFATFELLLASVYTGIARRALDLAIAAVQRRTSAKNAGRSYAQDPDARRRIAAAAIALDGIVPQIDGAARDLDELVDRGDLWMPQLSAIKYRATETAVSVVGAAMRAAGGSSYFTGNELSLLYRDVLAGVFHPSSEDSLHAAWANALLGPLE
jgi:alkylation response protein AidB-like acyl-CoA dehydrogenase